ncbi:MAG: polysaccharide lyase 6 family protein [Phycisphaerales bacterium]|nr:polysaccharide lyase 6 family protein [Phycisphaerales bacterium]MCB9837126.1 hypothetical protein [Phycisphaera sp.]
MKLSAILALIAGLPISAAHADDIFVSNASEITSALSSAQPGDVLVMTNGIWNNQDINFQGNGTASQPITLRAQTPGQVILTGNSTLEIGGQHLVVDGLYFKDGVLSAGDHVIQFRRGSTYARNCRLTNTVIENVNNPDIEERFFWVSLYGTDNTVDHCRFDGFVNRGVTLVIWDDWPNRHVIERNHFLDRPRYTGSEDPNGFETIRIGTSDVSMLSSQSVVHENLFERCDGEAEIVSNKSHDNTYTSNTFLESKGTLTLRHGNNALVDGNFFQGNNVSLTGGVRIIGEDHTVRNNYFENLDGRAGGVIVFESGTPNPVVSEYFQVKNAVVAHNTIVNCTDYAFRLDGGYSSTGRNLLPENCVIADNAVTTPSSNAVRGPDDGITWLGNMFHGLGLGFSPTPPGITMLATSPFTTAPDGLLRPSTGSPLIDAADASYAPALDMDGQIRDASPDVGADEVSALAATIGPLTEDDVGPDWWGVEPPTPQSGTVVIPGESADLFTDPDNNGTTWSIVSEVTALTGKVIKSPSTGGATVRPGEEHDALARFTIAFDAAGVYTLYVRSRGFSTSSDSFYAPEELDASPEFNQSSSNNSTFRWNAPTTILVEPGDVGLPRTITIGKREPNTEIDALIMSTDNGLSDSALDQLVVQDSACLGDLNHDGRADFLDYKLYMSWYSAGDFGADLDGSGVINSIDHAEAIFRLNQPCP